MVARKRLGPIVLIAAVIITAAGLAGWKRSSLAEAAQAAANQPEPVEAVQLATAAQIEHRQATTSIGTIVATRSISVRNELPGTVRHVALTPGQIVEAGTVLVALDVSVEQAELAALQAQAELAQTQYERVLRMNQQRAAADMELDSARAERDVTLAQIARTRAIIERKTIRAPFRARVGISDVHPGQYLNEGTLLTTLQGIDDAVYVDFTVAQQVASVLKPGDSVQVLNTREAEQIEARIVALDARVDPATRNAMVRAKIPNDGRAPAPGASVRVRVPTESPRLAVAIPASALRKGPTGDYVFVVEPDAAGTPRARVRQVQVETLAGDQIVLKGGLAAGEQVAASGSFKLRDAVAVVPSTEPSVVAQNATLAPAEG